MMVQDGHEERKNLLQTKVVLVGSRYFRAMGVYAKHLHDINKIKVILFLMDGQKTPKTKTRGKLIWKGSSTH